MPLRPHGPHEMAPQQRQPSAADKISDATGNDADEYSADGYEMPTLDELETVPVDGAER